MSKLPVPRSGLLSHKLDGQVLVYDTGGDRVHLLDPTTACVLQLLQEGTFGSEEAITAQLVERLGIKTHPGFLSLALSELYEAGLLADKVEGGTVLPDVTRRELLRSLAAAGVAAVAIPAIASLTATVGAAQPGQSFRGTGQACGGVAVCAAGLNCCGGVCRDGFCNGTACVNSGQCFAPNICCVGTLNTCEPTCPALGGACAACTTGAQCTSGSCGTGGACAPESNPGGFPSGPTPRSIPNGTGNCATGGATTRQNAANAACCSNSANITSCSGGTGGTIGFTCN